MGIRLDPPVHVQLVDDARIRTLYSHESGMVTGVTVVQGQRVTEVYVASGLPEVEFGATVAHECMHAWMAQNGFPKIDLAIGEGLCQVVAYRFLRDHKDPRASLLRQTIERMPDAVYGDGFRTVRDSVRRHGMNPVLAAVKSTGRLP